MSFHNRSDALIELLAELTQAGHAYVLVGGYAVSAFNTRFSTDLDIVVAPDSKTDFVDFLEARGFTETDSHARSGSTTRRSSSTKSVWRPSNRLALICS